MAENEGLIFFTRLYKQEFEGFRAISVPAGLALEGDAFFYTHPLTPLIRLESRKENPWDLPGVVKISCFGGTGTILFNPEPPKGEEVPLGEFQIQVRAGSVFHGNRKYWNPALVAPVCGEERHVVFWVYLYPLN
jgi:hypothetical protein